MVHFFPFCHPI